ncbi:hypothetical protein JCM1393_10190 [Clostridium carnis]
MLKKILPIILMSLSLLVGCSKDDKVINETNNISNSQNTKLLATPPKSSIVLSNKTSVRNKYLPIGTLVFFPDKENNNRLSVASIPTDTNVINQSMIKDFFEYPVESLATIGNYIYFSNSLDNNSLYKLDYQSKKITKLNNNYTSDIIANENTIFYINKSDGDKLYSYDIKNNTSKLLSSDKCGSFLLNGNTIFYQNLSDNSKIYSLSITTNEKTKITDSSANSFVIYKNQLLYFNSQDNNSLYAVNFPLLESKRIDALNGENLKTFDDKLFFINKEKGNTLFSLSLSQDRAEISELVFDSINDYYPTTSGIFLEKSIDINKNYIYK